MAQEHLFSHLIAKANSIKKEVNFDDLIDKIFTSPLTAPEQLTYLQLLKVAREMQLENPEYENDYRNLLYLYVLNGSRLTALKSIDRRLRGLKNSHGSLVCIAGISGIGKTSLASVFQNRAHQHDATFVTAHCREQEVSPYSLWQKVAREIEAIRNESNIDIVAPIGRGAQAQSPQHLIREFSDWLCRCAAERPLVIFLDDLQWADTDSLELLDSFTGNNFHAPIMFVATYRSEEAYLGDPLHDYLPKFQRNRAFDLITLEPLNKDDIRRLVSAYYGMCSEQLADYLVERAEGHALFTTELLDDLIKQGLLPKSEEGFWLPPRNSVPVSHQLRQLITQRVKRLGEQVERLLQLASVVGEIWNLHIVEQLIDLAEPKLITALEIAIKSGIIEIESEETETYRFSHGLIRQVLYQQQIIRRRKRLHEQIAIQFESQMPGLSQTIAFHAYEGEDWPRAAAHYMNAAQEASRRLANNSALHFYQRALTAAQRDHGQDSAAKHVAIYERLGRIYHTLEQRQNAEIAYGRMRDSAKRINDLGAEGRALANIGYVRISNYQFELAKEATTAALKIAERSDDSNLYARAYMNIIKLLSIQGELKEFDKNWRLFLENAEKLNDLVSLSEGYRYFALKSVWMGQYEPSEIYARKALEYAHKTTEPLTILGGHQVLSFARIERGQYVDAYSHIESVLANNEIVDTHHHQLPRLLNQMGYLLLEIGAPEEALSWDKRALIASQNTQGANVHEMQRYSLLNIATDLLSMGQINEALDYVAQFEAIKDGADYVRFRYYNRYLLLMGEIQLQQQAYEQALELAREARLFARKYNNSKNIAKSHWLEGAALLRTNHHKAAIQHLRAAVEIADQIQHGSLGWKIRLTLIEAVRGAGKSATQVLSETRHSIDRLIDSLSGSHLQELFLASGWVRRLEELEISSKTNKPKYPAGLTPREVEVLRLVASGNTNRQVAVKLHISPRTVNTHMSNILNKTNCENRTAATAFAIRHNLVPS